MSGITTKEMRVVALEELYDGGRIKVRMEGETGSFAEILLEVEEAAKFAIGASYKLNVDWKT